MALAKVEWWRAACRALERSGVARGRVRWLSLPLNREARLRQALSRRRAVLEAKNSVVDLLTSSQVALARFKLREAADVQRALQDPQAKPILLAVGLDRDMLAAEVARKFGIETGTSLDEALAELIAEGQIARVATEVSGVRQELFFALHGRARRQYDLSEISRLLREGRDYRRELQTRNQREMSTGRGRSYDL